MRKRSAVGVLWKRSGVVGVNTKTGADEWYIDLEHGGCEEE